MAQITVQNSEKVIDGMESESTVVSTPKESTINNSKKGT